MFDPWALLELVADAIYEVQQVANNPAYLYSSRFFCRSHSIGKQRGCNAFDNDKTTKRLLQPAQLLSYHHQTRSEHSGRPLGGSWILDLLHYELCSRQKNKHEEAKNYFTLALIKVCTKENADRERLVPEALPMSGHNRSQRTDDVTADTISQSCVSVFSR